MDRQKVGKRPGNYHKLQIQSSKSSQGSAQRRKRRNIPLHGTETGTSRVNYNSSVKTEGKTPDSRNLAAPKTMFFFLKMLSPKKIILSAVCLGLCAVIAITALYGNAVFQKSDPILAHDESLIKFEMSQFLADSTGRGGTDFTIDAPFELLQLNPTEYTIENGDTIYELAKKFNIMPQTLVSYNNISNTRSLYVGQKLLIPKIDGMPYTVKKGDSLLAIANKYNTSINDLLDANNLATDVIAAGQKLFIPGAVDNYQYKRAIGKLILWPVSGRITSRFGYRKDPILFTRRFHYGLDIANHLGTRINSAIDGKVVEVSKHSGFGNYIVVQDRYGLQTYYAHLSKFSVRKGQYVKQGQKIGEMGSTGRSTGSHLHFAVYKNGKAVDPMTFLQ